jgi:hypothetical protein
MAQINLESVPKKVVINDDDRIAIWPDMVTASSDLEHTTVQDIIDIVEDDISTSYIPLTSVSSKGTLLAGTAPSEVAGRSVGTNGQVLLADSVEPTGLRWGTVDTVGVTNYSVTTEKLKPLEVQTLPTGGTVNIDFAGPGFLTQGPLTANPTFLGSNYGPGRSVTVRVVGGTVARPITFPTDWVFVGVRPTSVPANRTCVLTVTSFGSVAAACVAAWASQL